MKKVLLSLIILIVLGGLGGYYYVGMVAEKDLKKSVSDANLVLQEQAQESGALKLSLQNYDRGIFNSHADLVVSMDIKVPSAPNRPAMRMPALSYPIKLDIAHGPFIFKTQKFGIGYAKALIAVPEKIKGMAKMMFTDNSTLPKMEIDWYLNFNEDSQVKLSIPEFMLEGRGNKGSMDWKGLDTVVHITDGGHKMKGYSLMNGIDGHSPHGRLSVGEVRVDYDMHYSLYKIWLGDATFKLPSLGVMTGEGKSIIAITDFMMKSSADLEGKRLNMGLESSLAKCVVLGDTYGPGELDLAFNGLHAQTFNTLQAKLQAINNPAYSKPQREQMLMALMPDFLKLVSGADIELRKFNFNLPQGKIQATAKLTAPVGDVKVTNPLQLLSQFHLVTHLAVPKTLVKMALVTQAKSKIEEDQRLIRAGQLSKPMEHDTATSSDSNVTADATQANNQTTHAMADGTGSTSAEDNQAEVGATQNVAPDTQDASTTILTKPQIDQLAEKKTEAQLAKLLSLHFLREEGNSYVVDLIFDKGHLTVNGQPATPDMLKQ